MTIDLSHVGIDYSVILPEVVVVVTALVVLFLDLFVPPGRRTWLAAVTVIGLAGAIAASIPLWGLNRAAFGDTVVGDTLAAFFDVLLLGISILTVLISPRFLRALDINYGEYYVLLLGATAGMMLLAAATSLMTIFLGIELLSICLYVLSGFARSALRSQESAMKYLLLGGFATGFLLYGMALIYGATGSTTLRGIAAIAGANGSNASGNVLLLLGIFFLIVGLAFKASAAPFHMWTPDVYEGAPTIVTTFMSVATKSAAFAAIGRVFLATFPSVAGRWYYPLAIIAIFSLFIGNLVAITQDNLKRMLAYSGVAHAGYILLGILPNTSQGFAATLFYIASYSIMNFGAFAVITALGAAGEETADIGYWRGLFYRRPFLASVMTIFMLSLAGIPPTVGFFAKLFVFQALVSAQLWVPLAIAIIMTIVSFYYYLRVIVAMVTAPAEGVERPVASGFSTSLVLGAGAAATILLGIFPSVILNWATHAASIHF
jgi:NADH-quinone oxidoreductase subunit N